MSEQEKTREGKMEDIDELPVIQDVPGWPGQHRVIGGRSEATVLTTTAAWRRMMAPE
jgi:hypothetical protein